MGDITGKADRSNHGRKWCLGDRVNLNDNSGRFPPIHAIVVEVKQVGIVVGFKKYNGQTEEVELPWR